MLDFETIMRKIDSMSGEEIVAAVRGALDASNIPYTLGEGSISFVETLSADDNKTFS